MARYLITGIAGFIGSALAHALVARGEQVRGIDNLSSGHRENLADIENNIEFIEGDLLDKPVLIEAVRDVDYVLHHAAIPSVPLSVADPDTTNEVNLTATLRVLLAARDTGVKRVVYASSSALYGDSQVLPKHEAMRPEPISPYAVQKLAGEAYMRSFSRVYGLATVALRYFNVFGPRQDPTSQYSGVLARFVIQMLQGNPPVIYGDGLQSRDFVYIDDVVAANLLACSAPAASVVGTAFNIASGQRTSVLQAYIAIARALNFTAAPVFAPVRTGDIQHSVADITLAVRKLGYVPRTTFEQGLAPTIEWYKNKARNGDMAQKAA